MKSNDIQKNLGTTMAGVYRRSCEAVLARVKRAGDAILSESLRVLKAPEKMMRLALKEAEALAWETQYPDLVFPDLAAEKIQAVARWSEHQEIVRGVNRAV